MKGIPPSFPPHPTQAPQPHPGARDPFGCGAGTRSSQTALVYKSGRARKFPLLSALGGAAMSASESSNALNATASEGNNCEHWKSCKYEMTK